jgi:FAD/FMN-containing dehydrogenase
MRTKSNPSKSFYDKRDLPTPSNELWPQDAGELREVMLDAKANDLPRLLLGDGQHLRTAVIGERSFDVVRTQQCNRIISVDRESKIVRVECGMRWGELQDELHDRGLSLARYALYPSTATVGGLLARRHPVHREMWDGDIRTNCCALSAVTPRDDDYRYIAAPRKAAGPDLRYLHVGAEGVFGAILDASLVGSPLTEGRLFTWHPENVAAAVTLMKSVWDAGVHTSWVHYTHFMTKRNPLRAAVHGPARLLDEVERQLATIDDRFEVGGTEDVDATRRSLEDSHPERRTLASSRRTVMAAFSLHDLPDAIGALPDSVEALEIPFWTRHRATCFIRYQKGKTSSELPAAAATRALVARPVIDDEAVHWTAWSQTLKSSLDPDRRLALGP